MAGYCSVADVRNLTNIKTADLSDAQITETILLATAELNSAINCRIYREEVKFIDNTRENDIDGANKTFYVKNFKGKFIADYNNDGNVASKITQPPTATLLAVVSSNLADTQTVTIYGIVSGIDDSESLTLNGTSYVEGVKQFSNISKIILSGTTVGDISIVKGTTHSPTYYTITAGSTSVTNIEDLIVYLVDSNGNESIATVASFDPDNGSFTLAYAPTSGYSMYVTYAWSYISEANPSKMLVLACSLLSSAYSYAKINFGRAPQVSFGNLKIYRHMDSFDKFYKMYQNIVNRINAKAADWSEARKP